MLERLRLFCSSTLSDLRLDLNETISSCSSTVSRNPTNDLDRISQSNQFLFAGDLARCELIGLHVAVQSYGAFLVASGGQGLLGVGDDF